MYTYYKIITEEPVTFVNKSKFSICPRGFSQSISDV